MTKFALAVQLNFEIEIDPASGQELSAENVRQLAWRRLAAHHPEQWQIAGVKSRWHTQSFSPATAGVAEVVEVTPEMEAKTEPYPRWQMIRRAEPPGA